jgi:hypothetical protein
MLHLVSPSKTFLSPKVGFSSKPSLVMHTQEV